MFTYVYSVCANFMTKRWPDNSLIYKLYAGTRLWKFIAASFPPGEGVHEAKFSWIFELHKHAAEQSSCTMWGQPVIAHHITLDHWKTSAWLDLSSVDTWIVFSWVELATSQWFRLRRRVPSASFSGIHRDSEFPIESTETTPQESVPERGQVRPLVFSVHQKMHKPAMKED